MADTTLAVLTNAIRQAAHPLTGEETDYDSLMELIGNARFVLLGEASYGTHEFYRARADITQRLITEKGIMKFSTRELHNAFALFQSSPHSGELYEESSRPA